MLGNNFLQSVLHPDLHPHINTLHDIPSTLVKSVSGPVSELINARSELQDMLHPNGSFLRSINEARENRKARKNLKNNLAFPIGQPPIVGLAQPNSHKNVRTTLLQALINLEKFYHIYIKFIGSTIEYDRTTSSSISSSS